MGGVGDDNVHVHNTMQLVEMWQRAGKNFSMMIYPGEAHSMSVSQSCRTMLHK